MTVSVAAVKLSPLPSNLITFCPDPFGVVEQIIDNWARAIQVPRTKGPEALNFNGGGAK